MNRCQLDGTEICEAHKYGFPSAFYFVLLKAKHTSVELIGGGLPYKLQELVVCRLCPGCYRRVVAYWVPKLAQIVKRHARSAESAVKWLVQAAAWKNTVEPHLAFGPQFIKLAYGVQPWLLNDSIGTLCVLYAKKARRNARSPAEIEIIKTGLKLGDTRLGVVQAWVFTFNNDGEDKVLLIGPWGSAMQMDAHWLPVDGKVFLRGVSAGKTYGRVFNKLNSAPSSLDPEVASEVFAKEVLLRALGTL